MKAQPTETIEPAPPEDRQGGYVVPLIHARVAAPVVDVAFFAALTGTTMLGLLDPPLAVLLGAGVLVARHRR